MNWFKNMKIGPKLIVMLVSVNVLSLVLIMSFVLNKFSSVQKEMAYKYSSEMAMNYGNMIDAELEVAMNSARTLAQVLAGPQGIR